MLTHLHLFFLNIPRAQKKREVLANPPVCPSRTTQTHLQNLLIPLKLADLGAKSGDGSFSWEQLDMLLVGCIFMLVYVYVCVCVLSKSIKYEALCTPSVELNPHQTGVWLVESPQRLTSYLFFEVLNPSGRRFKLVWAILNATFVL